MNACRLALERLFAAPDIGAVGAKLIRTNGLLQEAGSIIWRDGTTFGYLRGADPNAPEANFLREVDYCSGAFLMLRSALVKQFGGFDDDYRPAYYEEADLCVRLRKAGWRILYDPAVVVQHFEFGSGDITASTRLMARNHRVFTGKHLDYLRYQHPPRARNAVHARSPRTPHDTGPHPPRHILFIEDRIPLRRLGSGYVRSNDIIHSMAALGHLVSVFPIYKATASPIEIYRDMPETAEVLYERGMETLAGFIEERAGYYDIVWIGRTHNLERLLPILGDSSSALPANGVVLDTEAIAAPRVIEQNRVLGRPQGASLDAALKNELACAYFCQKIIAVNELDAALVRRGGHSNVSVLGHVKPPMPTPASWSQRHDLLFLGAIHDPGSPNHDSLEWFVEAVLPLLAGRLAPEVRFTVAGFVRRDVDLSALGHDPRVDLIGPVEDLAALYNHHRVFIAPTRFAGGIPFKIHEAASYGLPVVATDLLCRQLGWRDGVEIMAGGTDDAPRFASAILALYNDPEAWNTIRRGALASLVRDNSQTAYVDTLRDILHDVTAGGFTPTTHQDGGFAPASHQGVPFS
jgi:glycosyltransferase involved in cell wall biosynthesis